VEIRQIPKDKLMEADEVFITSATRKVLPIVAVDGKIIGTGKPGKNTKLVMELFERAVHQ